MLPDHGRDEVGRNLWRLSGPSPHLTLGAVFPSSPSRRHQKGNFHFASCGRIGDVWNISRSPYVLTFAMCWMPNAHLHTRQALPVSLYTYARSCNGLMGNRAFLHSPSLSVPPVWVAWAIWSEPETRNISAVFASGGVNDVKAWGPDPRQGGLCGSVPG